MQNKNLRLIFAFILFLSPISALSLGYADPQEEFEITQEDIDRAVPIPFEVVLNKKDEHSISVMEKRHFETVSDYDSPKYRVARLESHLLGRTWEYSPIEERMKRLKLASQRKMLSGTSLPVSIRRNFSPKRIANDSTPVYEDENNVGIIDGLMKLYAPEVYQNWSNRKKRMNERYSDG